MEKIGKIIFALLIIGLGFSIYTNAYANWPFGTHIPTQSYLTWDSTNYYVDAYGCTDLGYPSSEKFICASTPSQLTASGNYYFNLYDHNYSSLSDYPDHLSFYLQVTNWTGTTLPFTFISSTVVGCMDEEANNYDPDATEDETPSLCTYDPVVGCMDEEANNYDPDATEDETPSLCTYDEVVIATPDEVTTYLAILTFILGVFGLTVLLTVKLMKKII